MGPSSFPDKKYTPLHDVSILFQIRWHCGVLSKLETLIVCSILCVLLACQLQIKKLVMSIPPFLPVMVRPAQATSLVAATAVPVCRSTGALPVVTLRTFFPAATGKVWAWNPNGTNLNDRLDVRPYEHLGRTIQPSFHFWLKKCYSLLRKLPLWLM